jgi:hypothetical protein
MNLVLVLYCKKVRYLVPISLPSPFGMKHSVKPAIVRHCIAIEVLMFFCREP